MLKRYATLLTAMIWLCPAVLVSGAAAQANSAAAQLSPASPSGTNPPQSNPAQSNAASLTPQEQPATSVPANGYEGKMVQAIQIPGVAEGDRAHILQLVAQKVGISLDRARVRESIRALYATGRFADIQAEVAPSGEGITLTFTTSPNFFLGAINVEGAPVRPSTNQIVNAAKLQLGELYTQEKLDRALENIRQLMQEGGFYRA